MPWTFFDRYGQLRAQTSAAASVQEVAYAEITSSVSVLSTTEATGTLVLTAPSFTADGTSPYRVEFFAQSVGTPSTAVGYVIVSLFEGSTQIGRLASAVTPAASQLTVPMVAVRKITPAAGSHVYSVTAYANVTTGGPYVGAGVGGAGVALPCFIRITKEALYTVASAATATTTEAEAWFFA